jgi:Ca2+-binding EF-hand superfamily protein
VANLHAKTDLKEDNLKKAFDFYDQDGNGQITVEELTRIFGAVCDSKTLQAIIEEVDVNHDKQVYTKFLLRHRYRMKNLRL